MNNDPKQILKDCIRNSTKEGFFFHSDVNVSANNYWLDLKEFNIQLFSQKEFVKDCLRKLLRDIIYGHGINLIVFTTTSYYNFRDYQLYAIDSIIRELIDEFNQLNPTNIIEYSYVSQKAEDEYELYPKEGNYDAFGVVGISMHHEAVKNLDIAMKKCNSKFMLCFVNMETYPKDIAEKSPKLEELSIATINISKIEKGEKCDVELNKDINPEPKEEYCPLKKSTFQNLIKCILSCIKMVIVNSIKTIAIIVAMFVVIIVAAYVISPSPNTIRKIIEAMSISAALAALIGTLVYRWLDRKKKTNAYRISLVITIMIFVVITILYMYLNTQVPQS